MKLQNTLGVCMASLSPLLVEHKGVVEIDKTALLVGGYKIVGIKFPAEKRGGLEWLSMKNEYRHNEFVVKPGKFYLHLEENNCYMPGDYYTHSAFTSPKKQLGRYYQTEPLPNAELWVPNGHEVVMSFKQKWSDRNAGRCVTANGLRYMLTPVPDFVQGWV